MKHNILCVDDEPDILDSLERLFRKKYNVLKAKSGAEALKLLKENSISLIITDQRMPEMTGVKFLEKSIKINPNAVRILLTGYTDIDSVVDAINSAQIYRYVTKPWDSRELSLAVDRAIERFEMAQEIRVKNIALEKANQELQSLDKAKSNFMILINHELKTPLTTLISFLDLLKDTKLDEDQKKYIDRIKKSTDRLERIILDVLELVSSETGQTKVKLQKISDKKLVEKVVEKTAEQHPLDFQLADLNFKADPQLTENVMTRLIQNAIQHGADSKSIKIETKKIDNTFHFEIQNTGQISKEIIEKILQPFATNEDIMHHSKGIGLGLSICQSLLKLQGSELKIKSSANKIICSFDFPLAE